MTAAVSNGLRSAKAECSDAYPSVAKLNDRWRVIACRHGIQWILQYRNRAEKVAGDGWRGRSYCRTKEALIRVCDYHAGNIDPAARAILDELPNWFPEKQNAPGRITGSVSTNCAQEVDYCKIVPDASVCHCRKLLGYLVDEGGHCAALTPERALIGVYANREAASHAIQLHHQEASQAA
jgi:hypothetical protein